MKWGIIESPGEECGSVRIGGGNPKIVWWKDELRERRMLGRKCWELEMEMQRKRRLEVYLFI